MEKKTKKKLSLINLWLPPFIWASIIFLFSSLTTVQTSTFYLGDFLIKKTAHIIEYGIFATLIYRALINSDVEVKKAMWASVLIAFIYGISDEIHQSFTPGRGPAVRDVVIDTVGASVFIFGIIRNVKKMPTFIQKFYKKHSIVFNY